MHWGWRCTNPNELSNARLGDALKDAMPSFDGGGHGCFCVVSSWTCVKNHGGLVEERSLGVHWAGGVPPQMSYWTLH